MNGRQIFEVNHVTFTYPLRHEGSAHVSQEPAIKDVSLSIDQGEYIAVVGPNGSGKSTVAKLLTGLLTPQAGDINLYGQPVMKYVESGDLVRYVGLVFQDPDAQSVATVVEEDVAFALENLEISYDEMHKRVEDALRKVDMWQHRDRDVHALSGGQKQRVAIASVLAAGPRCVIFDEATSMLDARGRREVNAVAKSLAQAGVTVIAITHHMEEVLQATRVVGMKAGAVFFDGTPAALFSDSTLVQTLHLERPVEAVAAEVLAEVFGASQVPSGLVDAKDFAETILRISGQQVRGGESERTSADAPVRQVTDTEGENERAVIQVNHLSHTYMRGTPLQHLALEDVSLQVQRGEIVAVVGATGSGKSTLSLYLNALYQGGKGQVVICGLDGALTSNVKEIRKRAGMLFQKSESQIFEALIGDEIAYGAFQFGATVDEARASVQKAMQRVGLDFEWRDRPTFALSGGQRRRVALASVLAVNPEILILDEPTSALDPDTRHHTLRLFARLRDETGMTIIFVTHQLEEVATLADRVLVLSNGRLVANERPRAWLSNAQAVEQLGLELPYAAVYVRAVCDALELDYPTNMPLTTTQAHAWLTQLAGNLQTRQPANFDGKGGHPHGEL